MNKKIYRNTRHLGLEKKEVDNILSKNGTYKAGTYYGTISVKDIYKAGTYYGTLSIKDL